MRSGFLWALLAAATPGAITGVEHSPKVAAADYSLRPLFHTPVGNLPGYAGDPNGMLYRADHEVYHLFWQCAPDELMKGGASWCHSVSVCILTSSASHTAERRLPLGLIASTAGVSAEAAAAAARLAPPACSRPPSLTVRRRATA